MANVHIKESQHKIDHPSHDPDYAEAVRKGKMNWPKMEEQFADAGEREDYLKRVNSNPNNVMGLPPFFPGVKIRSFISEWKISAFNEIRFHCRRIGSLPIFCTWCNKITVHSISPDQCFCPDCGHQRDYRI